MYIISNPQILGFISSIVVESAHGGQFKGWDIMVYIMYITFSTHTFKDIPFWNLALGNNIFWIVLGPTAKDVSFYIAMENDGIVIVRFESHVQFGREAFGWALPNNFYYIFVLEN